MVKEIFLNPYNVGLLIFLGIAGLVTLAVLALDIIELLGRRKR